jgi:hypothetical protein
MRICRITGIFVRRRTTMFSMMVQIFRDAAAAAQLAGWSAP